MAATLGLVIPRGQRSTATIVAIGAVVNTDQITAVVTFRSEAAAAITALEAAGATAR
jgi:hypothetical protein